MPIWLSESGLSCLYILQNKDAVCSYVSDILLWTYTSVLLSFIFLFLFLFLFEIHYPLKKIGLGIFFFWSISFFFD